MTRLLVVDGDPADDPCQFTHPHDSWVCAILQRSHGHVTHSFVGPREVTAEDVARAFREQAMEHWSWRCAHPDKGEAPCDFTDEGFVIFVALTADPEAT